MSYLHASGALLFHLTLWLALGLALGAFAAGCSSEQYRYVPAQNQGPGRQKALATYPDPVGPHSGFVRVSSLGVVTLRPKGDSKEFQALQLRISLSNQTTQSWVLNAQDQDVSFPNQGETKPVFANGDVTSLPSVEIRPGELRVIDLFFPLPQQISGAKDLPEFDFHWTFNSGPTQIAEMTPFQRQPIPEAPAYVYPYPGPYVSYGWGPRWWYGPRPYWW